MKKYECSYTFKNSNPWTYYVDVIAKNVQHAGEMATSCVSKEWGASVSPRNWNVSEKSGSYEVAKVVSYRRV